MDMTKFLRRRFLTNAVLEDMGGRYEGVIATVAVEAVLNKWNLTKQEQPVIAFTDSWAWIPNDTARRVLIDAFGADTDDWRGQRVAIALVTITRTDKTSGRLIPKLEKRVEPLPGLRAVV